MKEYKIIGLKTGSNEEIYGSIVSEVEIEEPNGNKFYVSLADVGGIPNFYKSDVSLYNIHTDGNWETAADILNKYILDISDYEDVAGRQDDDLYIIYKYLIYSINISDDEVDQFVADTVQKNVDEIVIPEIDFD